MCVYNKGKTNPRASRSFSDKGVPYITSHSPFGSHKNVIIVSHQIYQSLTSTNYIDLSCFHLLKKNEFKHCAYKIHMNQVSLVFVSNKVKVSCGKSLGDFRDDSSSGESLKLYLLIFTRILCLIIVIINLSVRCIKCNSY